MFALSKVGSDMRRTRCTAGLLAGTSARSLFALSTTCSMIEPAVSYFHNFACLSAARMPLQWCRLEPAATVTAAHLLERYLPHVHLRAERQQHRMLAMRVCAPQLLLSE